MLEFVEGADGKLSHLRIEQRDSTGEQVLGKDGEPLAVGGSGENAGWPWEQRDLDVEGAFVAIGHTPNTHLLRTVRKDSEGYIYTIPGSTVTSVTGVYAAGDVADPVYR